MDSYSSFADVEVSAAAEKRLGIVLFSVDLSYFVLLLFEKRRRREGKSWIAGDLFLVKLTCNPVIQGYLCRSAIFPMTHMLL